MALSNSLPLLTIYTFFLLVITKSAVLTHLETPLDTTPLQQKTPSLASDFNGQSSTLSHKDMLRPILSHLGFKELATVAPYLSNDAASGPSTLFAPSDSSLRTCFSCSAPSLLREHLVPGLFTIHYLRKLSFGTKIETRSPGRCITVTSSKSHNDTVSEVFIGGVEITRPDLFNNGFIVIHGIQGHISPLSSLSCEVQRTTSLPFPFQPSDHGHHHRRETQPPIMSLMLRDLMLRLQNSGFGMLSLAIKVKYEELMTLTTMTVFALDDVSIFSSSYTYISNLRYHIVPNRYLTIGDLERLPVGTTLPTLQRGQSLTVTTTGVVTRPLKINCVRVMLPEIMNNLKIMVYGISLPFPQLRGTVDTADELMVALGTNTVPSLLFAAVSTCTVVGVIPPRHLSIQCSSRDWRRRAVERNQNGMSELYERYSVVKVKEAFDEKYKIEREYKEIDGWGTKMTKSMKRELQKLKRVMKVIAIDIGTSNVGVSLFREAFDELELLSGNTKMLEKVKPLCGFSRANNKHFICKKIKESKADIIVVGNTYGENWKNTDVENYLRELRNYKELRGKIITLGDETYTSQIVKFLEEMKCEPLLNLKCTVEEMKFQSWEEMEPYKRDVQCAIVILARAICDYLGYKDPHLSFFDS